jgi:hypothetical protein
MHTKQEAFDKHLNQIDHFKRYPAMLPYIGKNYGVNGQLKILLVAESNYLPEESTIQQNAEIWYSSEQSRLTDEEVDWINCRDLLQCSWSSDGHMIYRELENNLKDYFNKNTNEEKAISNVAYMNGFQRPSPVIGESIKHYLTQTDCFLSAKIISNVISIIDADLVVFVSKLAWDRLNYLLEIDDKVKVDFTCHPGTGGRYWFNKNYSHGRDKFRSILNNYISQKL